MGRGRAIIGIVFTFELWTAVLAFFVMVGENLHLVIESISKQEAIIVCGVVTFMLLYASVRLLAYISMLSVVSVLVTLVALAWSGIALPSGGPEFWEYHTVARPDGLFTMLGLSLFCFAGHPCLPNIYWNM